MTLTEMHKRREELLKELQDIDNRIWQKHSNLQTKLKQVEKEIG